MNVSSNFGHYGMTQPTESDNKRKREEPKSNISSEISQRVFNPGDRAASRENEQPELKKRKLAVSGEAKILPDSLSKTTGESEKAKEEKSCSPQSADDVRESLSKSELSAGDILQQYATDKETGASFLTDFFACSNDRRKAQVYLDVIVNALFEITPQAKKSWQVKAIFEGLSRYKALNQLIIILQDIRADALKQFQNIQDEGLRRQLMEELEFGLNLCNKTLNIHIQPHHNTHISNTKLHV